ncbi:MAG: hypothetical protein SGPRY_002869 [Prymnesium sp.]
MGERYFHFLASLLVFTSFVKTFGTPESRAARALLSPLLGGVPLIGECSLARNMHEWQFPFTPKIIGTSPHLFQMPSDFNPAYARRFHVTGFWVLPEAAQLQITKGEGGAREVFGGEDELARISAFLVEGEAPVYVGWGSMIATSPCFMAKLAVHALLLAKRRGIVLGGFAKLSADMLSDGPQKLIDYARENVLFVSSAPHEWLLPKCAVLVHHGGSGTTAAALRAGVPMVVTPCLADQFDNAAQIAREGGGVNAGALKKLTPECLAKAVREASTEEVKRAASRLGEQVRDERGLENASELLLSFYKEEVASGVWAGNFKAVLEERMAYRWQGYLYGLVGAFHSIFYLLRALVFDTF